jgi:hypothetical protein
MHKHDSSSWLDHIFTNLVQMALDRGAWMPFTSPVTGSVSANTKVVRCANTEADLEMCHMIVTCHLS